MNESLEVQLKTVDDMYTFKNAKPLFEFEYEEYLAEGAYTTAILGNEETVVCRQIQRDELEFEEFGLSCRHITEISANILINEIASFFKWKCCAMIQKTSSFQFEFVSQLLHEHSRYSDYDDDDDDETHYEETEGEKTNETEKEQSNTQSDETNETNETNETQPKRKRSGTVSIEKKEIKKPKNTPDSLKNVETPPSNTSFKQFSKLNLGEEKDFIKEKISPIENLKFETPDKTSSSSWEDMDEDYPNYLVLYHGYGGHDLGHMMEKRKKLTFEHYEDISVQILENLFICHHGAQIVHGDIKPNNIIIDNDLKSAALIDYNLCRKGILHKNIVFAKTTIPMYNSRFRPPEMWEKEDEMITEVTSQSDMWAFGMLLVCFIIDKDLPIPVPKKSKFDDDDYVLKQIEKIADIPFKKCHLERGKKILSLLQKSYQYQKKHKNMIIQISKCLMKNGMDRATCIDLLPKNINYMKEMENWRKWKELEHRAIARKGWVIYPEQRKYQILEIFKQSQKWIQQDIYLGKTMDLFEIVQGKLALLNFTISIDLFLYFIIACYILVESLYSGEDIIMEEVFQSFFQNEDSIKEENDQKFEMLRKIHLIIHDLAPSIDHGYSSLMDMILVPTMDNNNFIQFPELKEKEIEKVFKDFVSNHVGVTTIDYISMNK